MLNGFHRNIQFPHEVETDSKISFLDVLVTRDSSNDKHDSIPKKQRQWNLFELGVFWTRQVEMGDVKNTH